MNRRPSYQFYPRDWLADPTLRRCTPEARAAWIDLLCIMHDCDVPGILRTKGDPWSVEDAARAVGCTPDVIRELITKGVLRRAPRSGTFWSKRMLRDELARSRWARNAAAGGRSKARKTAAATPANTPADRVPDGVPDGVPNDMPKRVPKRSQKTPSSSSSSSSSSKGTDANASVLLARFSRWYSEYPHKVARGQAERAWLKIDPPPTEEFTDRCIAAIRRQMAERAALEKSGRFVPEHKHPATWLHGRCWEDAPYRTDQKHTHGTEIPERHLARFRALNPDQWDDYAASIGIVLTDQHRRAIEVQGDSAG